MSEKFLTLREVENMFQSVIVSALGWADDSPSKENDVRISWPTGGAPAPSIDKDYVFIQVMEQDHPINRQRDVSYEASSPDLLQSTGYTRVMLVILILYGSGSFDNAQIIRDAMFSQSVKQLLAESDFYIVPDIASPKRMPELFEGQWWERVDFQLTFNNLVVRETEVNEVDSVEVGIETSSGDSAEVIISR